MRNTSILVVLSLFANIAFAGLPPTTTKGQLDLKGVTTFNYQFPGYPITHTGTTASIGTPSVALPNYVGLDATWANTQVNDRGAEATLGNWAAYNNTVAGVSPDAGMTGGTPSGNVLLTRTTAAGQVLDGIASFLITKGAFNVQGEGFSVIANVPPAFRTQSTTISIPFKVISGNYVQGDLKVFLYDVTNSQVITPFNNDVVGSQGVITAIAALSSTTAQIRVGFHFASTVATALTIAFDDVSVGPNQAAMGMAGSNSSPIILTFDALGVTTGVSATASRVGDRLFVRGRGTSGTVTAANLAINLPSGMNIDYSKQGASTLTSGSFNRYTSSSIAYPGTSNGPYAVFTDGSTSGKLFIGDATVSNNFRFGTGTGDLSNGDSFDFSFNIPIAGWDANVTMAQSSTFKISSYLANGVRVVGVAPANLGEYQSFLRNASAQTYTEVSGTPTVLPTSADGMKLYTQPTFTTADTANQPSKYIIFVGKNKNVTGNFYKSPGRTGEVIVNALLSAGGTVATTSYSYDPTTGNVTIVVPVVAGVAMYAGTDSAGGAFTSLLFDITVSENALAVGVQAPRSEVITYTGNSVGTVNTTVRRFISSTTIGGDVTYADSATLGASFTINTTGVYSISYSDVSDGVADFIGITRNGSALTTNIGATSIAQGKVAVSGLGNVSTLPGVAQVTLNLNAGEVIRPGCSPTNYTNANDNVIFRITKVSN